MNPKITVEQKLPTSVKITGINIPFWDMMIFMIKWAFASVPVIIFLMVLWGIVEAIFLGVNIFHNPYDLR
jgi:hypothetical protein